MTKLFAVMFVLGLVGLATPALAQVYVAPAPVVVEPTVTYYAPSTAVTSYYAPAVSAPVTTYYAPSVATSYYAAPVTSYYAPVTSYYAPAVTSYYAPAVTSYYSPVVSAYYAPYYAWRPYYVPGQPVRNAIRAGRW